MGAIGKCLSCHESHEIVARGICMTCYSSLKKRGELEQFPRTKYGTPEEEPLPVRPRWEYEPAGGAEALAEMTARLEAERNAKAAKALEELKQFLTLTSRLTVEQKKRILEMASAQEIEQFVATIPVEKKTSVTPEQAQIKTLIAELNRF